MASHYSSIGVSVDSEDDLEALVEKAAYNAEIFSVGSGEYLRWQDASGAALILQVDRGRNLIGAHPHFFGETGLTARVTGRVHRRDQTAMDGAFHAWASPDHLHDQEGAYPFVFDCPEALRFDRFRLPCVAEVQLAAFAHEVSVFASDEEHAAAQTEEPHFASQSFIPIGLFGDRDEGPQALALLTGRIRRQSRRVNRLTGSPFCWAEVETYEATIDVVMDPTLLNAEPRSGGVISGTFWLSGQLKGYAQRTQRFLNELLSREER